jgi:hypothetical protein
MYLIQKLILLLVYDVNHYLLRGDWDAPLFGETRDGLDVIAQVTLAAT